MRARIYQPAKTAMQSGMAKTRKWVLDYAPETARDIDPLMGWTSSTDMQAQVRLSFDTKEAALAYAEAHGLEVTINEPHCSPAPPTLQVWWVRASPTCRPPYSAWEPWPGSSIIWRKSTTT